MTKATVILISAIATTLLLGSEAIRLDAQQPTTVTVDIQDFSFQPRDLTVNVGTTVRWVNRDTESPHSVAAEDGKTITSPLINPGKESSFEFTQTGQMAYRCGVHPTMMGVIVVQGP